MKVNHGLFTINVAAVKIEIPRLNQNADVKVHTCKEFNFSVDIVDRIIFTWIFFTQLMLSCSINKCVSVEKYQFLVVSKIGYNSLNLNHVSNNNTYWKWKSYFQISEWLSKQHK